MKQIPPFITKELCESPTRRLRIVSDVSCDPNNPNNPVPIYDSITYMSDPVRRVMDGKIPLEVTAIDHLPSLIPNEASTWFSNSLIETLIKINNRKEYAWNNAKRIYFENLERWVGGVGGQEEEEKKGEGKEVLVWMRDEVKPGERRTPLTPENAGKMIAAGYSVVVERSKNRVFSLSFFLLSFLFVGALSKTQTDART